MDLSEITPVTQDYLKAIWSAIEWGEPPITTTALAHRFGTSAPNVSDTIKRLAAQGLVDHQPYRPVTLTSTGREYAVAMVRRHRLLESLVAPGWSRRPGRSRRIPLQRYRAGSSAEDGGCGRLPWEWGPRAGPDLGVLRPCRCAQSSCRRQRVQGVRPHRGPPPIGNPRR